MPSVNEMIDRLIVMRDQFSAGELPVAIGIAGEDGFTTLACNVLAPPVTLDRFNQPQAVMIGAFKDIP